MRLVGRAPALLFEDVGLGVDLEARVRQPEAARQQPFGDEHGAFDAFVGLCARERPDLVVAQQFHRPLGAAVGARDEEDRLAALARLFDVGNPVRDAAAKLLRGLHRDVQRVRPRRRRLVGAVIEGELFERDSRARAPWQLRASRGAALEGGRRSTIGVGLVPDPLVERHLNLLGPLFDLRPDVAGSATTMRNGFEARR